jgi:outer membrane protein OmpA-like peptidoglycan-associated protein
MNFQDPFDRNGSGLGIWPTLKGVSRPRPQGPEPAPAEDAPTPEMIQANTPRPDPVEQRPKAKLSDSAWVEPDTLFNQEAKVSAKLSLPEGKAHVTRVQVELFAKTANGPESISTGEGHAQADGTAVVALPIYKPKNHDGGPVEYFFRVMHSLADMLTGENTLRTVSETALKSADHVLVSGTVFEKDSSFISPQGVKGLKRVEQKFQEWEKKHPQKSQVAVFGHTDKDEKDAKALSERRAQSAYAFITEDAAAWEKLYAAEKWGLKALQALLKDLDHYHGIADGKDGPKTQEAFKAFQKGAGLPETGQEDAATRKALFSAYMQGKRDVKIDASRFCKVAGHPWMGCAAYNRVKESEEPAPENRRVAFVLITPSKNFPPVHFPCQDGNEAACQAQCKRKGTRSAAGIKCAFYDELLREKKQEAPAEEPKKQAPSDKGPYDIEKAVVHLNANALDASIHKCATYVRQAIQAGGGNIIPPYPLHAKDYGPTLIALGFKKVDKADYTPKKGDVAVFDPPSGKPDGHIQMFNGEIWVSDFFQRGPDIYPGKKYREEQVSYEIYRP